MYNRVLFPFLKGKIIYIKDTICGIMDYGESLCCFSAVLAE